MLGDSTPSRSSAQPLSIPRGESVARSCPCALTAACLALTYKGTPGVFAPGHHRAGTIGQGHIHTHTEREREDDRRERGRMFCREPPCRRLQNLTLLVRKPAPAEIVLRTMMCITRACTHMMDIPSQEGGGGQSHPPAPRRISLAMSWCPLSQQTANVAGAFASAGEAVDGRGGRRGRGWRRGGGGEMAAAATSSPSLRFFSRSTTAGSRQGPRRWRWRAREDKREEGTWLHRKRAVKLSQKRATMYQGVYGGV